MTEITMEKTNEFARFDVVLDDSDHHYCGAKYRSNSTSRVHKSIMREWKSLEENLPESIYVRVYERRIDLLRAVIVGAAGTPYHDGLFFFDIKFPSDYPTHPPKVHYRSFGHRLNPNLYASGKVCLSLLNTWNGKKCEKWDPSGSTLLQVLLSIQGLVLNEKPFYNEPAYSSLGRNLYENNSRAYNESVFTLTCITSFHLLRKPPSHFEAFVADHFRRRGLAILSACNEYAHGRVVVGYYNHNGLRSSSSTVHVSGTFKEGMEKWYPHLLQEFQRCDASLGTSVEHLELEIKRCTKGKVEVKVEEQKKNSIILKKAMADIKKTKVEEQKKNSGGILKKAVAKIKKVLGWKSSGKKKISGIEG